MPGDHQADAAPGATQLLWGLVQAYRDEYGATVTWIAAQMGTDPQTLYNWRDRPMREMPKKRVLRSLAAAIRQPEYRVLAAAMIDSGIVEQTQADEVADELRRITG